MAVVTLLSSIWTLPKPAVFTGLHSFQEKLTYLIKKNKQTFIFILKHMVIHIVMQRERERLRDFVIHKMERCLFYQYKEFSAS